MILALVGCRSAETHRNRLTILKIQSPTAGSSAYSPEHLISTNENLHEFFETSQPFPQTVDIELDPSEQGSLKTYALVTGNHGNDSILRMPRAWTVSGSNDGASWTVVDRQDDSRPWKLNEERFYKLSSPVRYKHFRFVFTQGGPTPGILRIYRLRLYSD
jgi:hypothetical protein